MKRFITLYFLSLVLLPVLSQEKTLIDKERIEGRWHVSKTIAGDTTKEAGDFPDTYIFRDNGVFHKGEAAEGVILFSITGRYALEGDIITVFYKDYIESDAGNSSAKKLVFRIISLSQNEMSVIVTDYDYEYKLILNK